MKDLNKVIQSYLNKDVLLVSDYNIATVANEILRTVTILQNWNLCSWPLLDYMLLNEFKLDIRNNDMHRIMWENWMRFISELDLINIETQWAYPSELSITDDDIYYLEDLSRE